MGRKERRIQKKFEKNPIRELNKGPEQILQPALLEVFPDRGSPASKLYYLYQPYDAWNIIL